MSTPSPAPARSGLRPYLVGGGIVLVLACACLALAGIAGGFYILRQGNTLAQLTHTQTPAAPTETATAVPSPTVVPSATATAAPPTLTPTSAPPTVTSTPTWPVVLSENFSSNANGWNISATQPETSEYGTFDERFAGGKFQLGVKTLKGVNLKLWPKGPSASDMALTVDAQRASGPTNAGYGLMFRRDAKSNFYLFEVRDTQQFSVWLYEGQWTALIDWTDNDAIRPGQGNRLSVTALGSHFGFSINDRQVGTLDNSQVSSGLSGIVLDLDGNIQAAFEFSNFELRAPGTAAQATTSSPAGSNTPVPFAQWTDAFSDNFSSNASGWIYSQQQPYTNDSGTWSERIGNGVLHVEGKASRGVEREFKPKMTPRSDLMVTVQARRVSGPVSAAYGLIFRLDDKSDDYIFEIRDDQQFSVSVYNQSQWTNLVPWTKSTAIQAGAFNQLAVTAVGPNMTFFVNNEQVGQVQNSQVPSGGAGVAYELSAGEQGAFEFANFQVLAPP